MWIKCGQQALCCIRYDIHCKGHFGNLREMFLRHTEARRYTCATIWFLAGTEGSDVLIRHLVEAYYSFST